MNGQQNATKNFTVQTITGQKIDYKIMVDGKNVREKIENAVLKLIEIGIDIDNVGSIYYNDVAYSI